MSSGQFTSMPPLLSVFSNYTQLLIFSYLNWIIDRQYFWKSQFNVLFSSCGAYVEKSSLFQLFFFFVHPSFFLCFKQLLLGNSSQLHLNIDINIKAISINHWLSIRYTFYSSVVFCWLLLCGTSKDTGSLTLWFMSLFVRCFCGKCVTTVTLQLAMC